jgi:transposase
MAVRGWGLPVRFILTGGQRNDITQAHALIDGLPAEHVLADAAYDADHFRDGASAQKAHAVIPSHPSRAKKHPLDKDIYKERHLVECCFSKLTHFRRVGFDTLTQVGFSPLADCCDQATAVAPFQA